MDIINIGGTIFDSIMAYLLYNLYKSNKNRKNKGNAKQNLTQSDRQHLTESEKAEILERQKHKCKKCGVKFYGKHKVRPHYDHINPIFRGGEKGKDLKNIQALCPNCHDAKTRKEKR